MEPIKYGVRAKNFETIMQAIELAPGIYGAWRDTGNNPENGFSEQYDSTGDRFIVTIEQIETPKEGWFEYMGGQWWPATKDGVVVNMPEDYFRFYGRRNDMPIKKMNAIHTLTMLGGEK